MNDLELNEIDQSWQLSLRQGIVRLIQIDFRLGLFLSDPPDELIIYVETVFSLENASGRTSLQVERPLSLCPMLAFFNARVRSVLIQKTGNLKVNFEDGSCLEVEPDNIHDAWQVASPSRGFLLVCSPGGTVSVFRDGQRPGDIDHVSTGGHQDLD
jgi:hypothetical protein